MRRVALLVLALVLPTVVGSLAHAATETFTDTVRVVMGSRESQDEVRVYATQEAKRRVLDKVGVYLSGSNEIVRKVQETSYLPRRHEGDANQNFVSSWLDSSSVLTRIQTLTVGVVQTEVVSEEWKSEGGSFVLYLVCRVTVDREDALARLTELLKDKQKVEDYQKVQEEVERLRGDLAQLRLDLESAKTEKEKVAVKVEVQEKINGLTANDWFEKGLAKSDFVDQIACYDFAIQLDPKLSGAYFYRGNAHYSNGYLDEAIADYDRVLQINPYSAEAYSNRACAYSDNGDYDKAISDYSHALRINTKYAEAYCGRGGTYLARYSGNYSQYYNDRTQWGDSGTLKGDLGRALSDLSIALQLDPNMVEGLFNRGLAQIINGNINSARSDFQKAANLGDAEAKKYCEEIDAGKYGK